MPEQHRTSLDDLGWGSFFADQFPQVTEDGIIPARVAIQTKGYYVLYSPEGELRATVPGRMLHVARGSEDLPAVGDWVGARRLPNEMAAVITGILPRRNKFSRKVPGRKTEEQVVAANIDIAFIVNGLDADFNPSRLERYLVLANESGVRPVIVLNKTDICTDLDNVLAEVTTVAGGATVLAMSALRKEGIEPLRAMLTPGVTGALLGSSGVGKSTIANDLLGVEHFRTQEVREDDSRGRHTTAQRELVVLPSGGLLIDTPGMREIQLLGEETAVQDAFDDIEEIATQCKFRNCHHETEPGCAVRAAIESGTLDPRRFESYLKLKRELAFRNRKENIREKLSEKEKAKKLSKIIREYKKGH